jgi:hypothetical protein
MITMMAIIILIRYIMMLDCWQHDPDRRPTFSVLASRLENILQVNNSKGEGHEMVVEMNTWSRTSVLK